DLSIESDSHEVRMGNGPASAPSSVETKTIRKVQARIIPLLFLLYIVAYLDRINIGFAALTMNKELAISSQQFGLLVGVFFFGYFKTIIGSVARLSRDQLIGSDSTE